MDRQGERVDKKVWLAYLAVFAVVVSFAVGGRVGRRDSDFRIYEYGTAQLAALEEEDHSASDEMVRNAVRLYARYKRKREAFSQLDRVWHVDSTWWTVQYCRAFLMDCEGQGVRCIKYYERALEGNNDCEVFDAGGGNYFSDSFAFDRLSNLYLIMYKGSINEYHRHLSEEYRRAAIECLNRKS